MHKGQAKCGAKTRRTGEPCKDIAMANGRCKRHGGKATGAIEPHKAVGSTNGNNNSGIYSRYLAAEDQALYAEVALGSVDAELRLMRVRLARTVKARREWEDSLKADSEDESHQVLVEVIDGDAPGKEGGTIEITRKTKRLPDFDKIEQACLARIESLEKTRKELAKAPEDDDDSSDGTSKDRIVFSGGLEGGDDDELPSPFDK